MELAWRLAAGLGKEGHGHLKDPEVERAWALAELFVVWEVECGGIDDFVEESRQKKQGVDLAGMQGSCSD